MCHHLTLVNHLFICCPVLLVLQLARLEAEVDLAVKCDCFMAGSRKKGLSLRHMMI